MSMEPFPWSNHISGLILPYIVGWFDLVADGNCGFVPSLRHVAEDKKLGHMLGGQ